MQTILIVGTPGECADLEYATGFRAPDPVVFLDSPRGRHLVVSALECERARRTTRHIEIWTPEMLGLTGAKRRRLEDWALKLLKMEKITRVTVPSAFPHGIARRLERAGIRVLAAKQDMFPSRAVKTAGELRKMAESQQAAVIAMRAAINLIAHAEITGSGYLRARERYLTSEDVRRMMRATLLEHDCFCADTIVAAGKHAADPHEKGNGRLRANEAIVIDVFPRHLEHGYCGDLTRTVLRGTASPMLKKMYQAVKAAQSAALDCVRPGVACATVHKRAAAELARRGFNTTVTGEKRVGFIHSVGHGVGLAIHEAPALAAGAGKRRLRSGNVITIEPGLYYPEIGGARIEDTIVVTPRGWRYLAPCERKFEV